MKRGKMSNKSRGIQVERLAKKELEAEGFLAVRSRGSFGKFDIIAMDCTSLRLIQCKRVKGKITPSLFKDDIEQLKKFNNCPEKTIKELWCWKDREGWIKTKL